MTAMGSAAHQALVKQVTAHYAGDPRVRAVAVFGSVGSGTWHELSDVDLDIVTADGVVIDPGAEARALFGVWDAIVAVERARHALTTLRGRRDGFLLDPADPLRALAAVVTEANETVDFGPVRRGILAQLGLM